MSFLNKQIALLAFLILLVPVMAIAQDTGVPDSVIVGNLDGSNIMASPGDTINIPLWVKNDQNPVLMGFPIAIDDQYIADHLDGNLFDILNPSSNPHWEEVMFTSVISDRPSVGLSTYPLFCMSEGTSPYDWVPFNSNGEWIQLAEFTFEISNDTSLIGTTTQILESYIRIFYGCTFLEVEPDDDDYHPRFVGGTIEIVASGYEYLAGDVNMHAGGWPPVVTGPDVTYLLNFFRDYPTSVPCKFDGDLGLFWASADANGDCLVTGSDITKLSNVLRGIGFVKYCGDQETDNGHYPPAWPPIPGAAPVGWPNCE